MPTKLERIRKVFYDGPLGWVGVNADKTDDLELSIKLGLGRLLRARVFAHSINTSDNSETHNFAQAILKAALYALEVNSERGV